jgi:hypothetical protein
MFNLRSKLLAGGFAASVLLAGAGDYGAEAFLNWMGGNQAMPVLASRFLALFTTAPTSDAGTGGTECSGNGYARIQVAGALAATATWTTATPNITMTTNPGWIVAGMNVYDATNSFQIGTVSTFSGTALVLTANASHASSGSTDSLIFSAFPAAAASSGTEPTVAPSAISNASIVTYPAATGGGAGFGTVVAFGLYDALTAGNFIAWDYLGGQKWLPFTCTLASPGVLTAPASSFATSSQVVVTTKDGGGALPTTGGSWTGLLTVTNISADTFSVAVNTTSTGEGEVRQVTTQAIPSGVVASFAAATMTITAA